MEGSYIVTQSVGSGARDLCDPRAQRLVRDAVQPAARVVHDGHLAGADGLLEDLAQWDPHPVQGQLGDAHHRPGPR